MYYVVNNICVIFNKWHVCSSVQCFTVLIALWKQTSFIVVLDLSKGFNILNMCMYQKGNLLVISQMQMSSLYKNVHKQVTVC